MHESFSLSSSVVNDRQRAILEEFAKDEFAYENDTSMERNWLELLHRYLFVKMIGYVVFLCLVMVKGRYLDQLKLKFSPEKVSYDAW